MAARLEGEAHVWALPLTGSQREVTRLRGLLSKEEAVRIGRQAVTEKRAELAVAWGRTREILADYIGCSPHQVPLFRQRNGKPIVERGVANGLTFSLSHSFPLAHLAIASGGAIGVDIERIRPGLPVTALAARFFMPREAAAIASLPEARRLDAFFWIWARKEAYLKGIGVGVPSGLRRCDVSTGPAKSSRGLSTRFEGRGSGSEWTLYDLDVPPGYAAALAMEGTTQRIVYRGGHFADAGGEAETV